MHFQTSATWHLWLKSTSLFVLSYFRKYCTALKVSYTAVKAFCAVTDSKPPGLLYGLLCRLFSCNVKKSGFI